MKSKRRWLSLILTALLAVSCLFPAYAQESSFSDFFIDASGLAFAQQSISIQPYERDSGGTLRAGAVYQVDCSLNQVTEDASFYIQPGTSGVWVTVDYLTDLNSDGIYELPNGGNSPVWDTLVPQSSLSLQRSTQTVTLNAGQTYVFSAQTLREGSQQAVKARTQSGSVSYLGLGQSGSTQDFPICLVRLHYTPSGGQEQIQSYYVQLYGQILLPSDVSPDADYYKAVEYVLSKGYFTGMDDGTFRPDGLFTRAQLAQILWRMGGSLVSSGCSFPDVDPNEWYYDAISWCCQNGIMTGLSTSSFSPDSPLSRQQMTLILYQYAKYSGVTSGRQGDLSLYPDGSSVSVWAKQGMEWAVGNGLLPIASDNMLNPSSSVTRSDMAMVLYAYDTVFSRR